VAQGSWLENLLELAVTAARARATLGEISDALESVFGRYSATIRSISGVYSAESMQDPEMKEAMRLADEFAKRKAAARASSWPRWARTATTAAPR
jgi:methylmalonyl-CoA mutase